MCEIGGGYYNPINTGTELIEEYARNRLKMQITKDELLELWKYSIRNNEMVD